MKIALLSMMNNPLLGYTLQELTKHALKVDAIIMDSMGFTEKHKLIFEERTAKRFPPIPLSNFEEQQIPVYYVENYSSDVSTRLVNDLEIDILANAGTARILKSSRLLKKPLLSWRMKKR